MEYRIAGPAQPGVVSSVCSPHARRDKVPLASAAWLVNAFPTPPLRYQLFPGVGYFHFIRKKERLLLLPRPVRSENHFKSSLSFGTKTKFLLEYGGKVSGPGTAGEDYFFAEALVCSPHAGRALPLERTKGSKVRQRTASPTQSPLCSSPLSGGYPPAPLCRLLREKSRLLRLLGCLCPLG